MMFNIQGDNGRTRVRIVAGNRLGHFRLDSRQELHIVRVESALDRETTTTYNLTVEAADLGNTTLELQMINRRSYTITEKTHTRTFS